MNKQELLEKINERIKYYKGYDNHYSYGVSVGLCISESYIKRLNDISEDYEVLSEEKIEGLTWHAWALPSNTDVVKVIDLKNLLVPNPSNSKGLENVKVPKFVAIEIERAKGEGISLNDVYRISNKFKDKFYQWLITENNDETFARAWLDGYEVEETLEEYVRRKLDYKMVDIRRFKCKEDVDRFNEVMDKAFKEAFGEEVE